MPELPEVETVKNGMENALLGRKVLSVQARRSGLRKPFPDKMNEKLTGLTVKNIIRRGKYIICMMEDNISSNNKNSINPAIIFHLGMSGRILIMPEELRCEPEKHDHLLIEFDGGLNNPDKNILLIVNDPRRFGTVDIVDNSNKWQENSLFHGMGAEPLSEAFDGYALLEKLSGTSREIKNALLDQRLVAGLGNIYVCEALYEAGISPFRLCKDITAKEAESMAEEIKNVLLKAIKAGGSTLRDYASVNGESGYFQLSFAVYGREGETCPKCSKKTKKENDCQIAKAVQSGRSSFYCPANQK